jgi:acyl carrier protein
METRSNDRLERELADMIFEVCNITYLKPADISLDDMLFGPQSPIGLDSIDGLELSMTILEKYGVRIDDQGKSLQVMRSIRTLADFIRNSGKGRFKFKVHH